MANLPIFAVGSYDSIQPAIDSGVLTYPAYIVTTDTKYENRLIFLDKDLSLRIINGGETVGERQVIRVTELPSVDEGDIDVLYIYENIVYVFTGEEYKPMFVDYSDKLSDISEHLEETDDSIEVLTEKVESLSGVVFVDLDEEYTSTTADVSTIEEMAAALTDTDIKKIVLTNNLLYDGDTGIVLDDGSSKTIELSGWNIMMTSDDPDADVVAIRVLNGSTLDITNSGEESIVDANNSNKSNITVEACDNSTINIFNGTYTCGASDDESISATVYGESGKVNIYGGFYENSAYTGHETNCAVLKTDEGNESNITCYGGEFVDQNPAKGDSMSATPNSTYVADGYTVVSSVYNETHTLYEVIQED